MTQQWLWTPLTRPLIGVGTVRPPLALWTEARSVVHR